MINGKRVLVYIPIRSGSKSIIDKNIVDVCGKPLVAYSIEAAKKSKYVDEIIVSTDSEHYARIVQQYGAKAPFIRPPELATDTAVEMDACLHLINWVETNTNEKFDIIIKLEATSALRTAEDVDLALETLEKSGADTVVTVTEALTPPVWMNTLPENQSLKDFIPKDVKKKNRQELPDYYQLDGVVYTAKWNFIKEKKTWLGENSTASITPVHRSIDVDGPIQLELVRILMKQRLDKEGTLSREKVNLTEQNVVRESCDLIDPANPVSSLFSLKGKVAVVTGGAGMLGMQHAEILSAAGAHVVIVDINQERCDAAAREIFEKNSVTSLGLAVDITQESSVVEMLHKIKVKFGRVDILVNNAAGKPENLFADFESYTVGDWDKVMDVNLKGTFLCSQIIARDFRLQKSGVIINIGSVYGIVGPDQRIYGDSGIDAPAVYSASKGAIVALTKYLASYYGKHGIRVNCLIPGGISNNQDEAFVKSYSARVPLGRMAKQCEMKGALLFLASNASSYVTGTNIIVDGGLTTW